MHVEYKCEVKEILSGAEFRARRLTPTKFPSSSAGRGSDVTPCARTGNDVTSCVPAGNEAAASCERDWGVYVLLTNGRVFGCDLVVSATGVTPSAGGVALEGAELALAEDGGVAVDREMRTNLSDMYAAGDVCSTQWGDHSNLWFQVESQYSEEIQDNAPVCVVLYRFICIDLPTISFESGHSQRWLDFVSPLSSISRISCLSPLTSHLYLLSLSLTHTHTHTQMRLWTQARQMGAYAAQCMQTHSRKRPPYPLTCQPH